MPTFLSDPPQAVYLVLGALLVVTGAIAAQKQDRRAVIPFAVAFFLMLAVFLIDRLIDSPREEAVRRVMQMAMAADQKHPDAFAEHLADEVSVGAEGHAKTLTRDELKKHSFWGMLRQFNVHVAVWDFSRDDVKVIDDNTVEIGFMGKGEIPGGQQIPVYCRARFAKQPDSSFKITTLRTFEPLDHTRPLPIPGLP
jgi:hypothetical protein